MNLEELRKFSLSLPHVNEDIKWGNDLCFLVGDKMFCVINIGGIFGASLKVTSEEFEILTEREGVEPAKYLARYKWISVKEENALSEKEWQRLIEQSYQLVKSKLPKKKLKELGE